MWRRMSEDAYFYVLLGLIQNAPDSDCHREPPLINFNFKINLVKIFWKETRNKAI